MSDFSNDCVDQCHEMAGMLSWPLLHMKRFASESAHNITWGAYNECVTDYFGATGGE